MDWLFAPIDAARAHDVSFAVSMHGRAMVVAWGVLGPLIVLVARYFKVLPWQDWPRDLDSQVWWRSHWIGASVVLATTLFAIGLVFKGEWPEGTHASLGYGVLLLAVLQVALGIFRGSKGGPTAPAADGSPRGDHYDMTPWRVMFEWVHKLNGYLLLGLTLVTLGFGMWDANAPRWMWLVLGLWWLGLAALCVILQRRGYAVDTYQAIWGPDEAHPGNRRKPIGWGIKRPFGSQPGE